MDFKKYFTSENMKALREDNEKRDIKPAPHEALLGEKPIGIAPENYRREILRTMVAPVPKPPKKTESTVETQKTGLDYFENQIESNSHLNNAVSSLSMVWGLLQQHYRYPKNSVLNQANFDRKNLEELLHALISQAKGTTIPVSLVVSYVRHPDRNILEALYSEVLGLTKDSTETAIDIRIADFLNLMDRLEELMAYPLVDAVLDANEEFDPEAITTVIEKTGQSPILDAKKIVDEAGIQNNSPLLFDVRAIQQMLAEIREREARKFYEDFYFENPNLPACSSLDCLQKALRADDETYELHYQDQHLRGKSMVDAVRHLDALFPEIRGAGRALLVASRDTATLTALLRDIAETHKIAQNPAAMQAKLNDIHQRLTRAFPKLANKRVAENMDKPAIQFEEEWKAIWKAPETARPFSQLHNLYYAFLNYSDKRKEQLFGGDELDVMLKKMSDALGPGLCAAMKRASVKKEDPYRCYALMQVIAKHSDTTRNPEDLKAKLIRIGRILEQTYPDLHNNLT